MNLLDIALGVISAVNPIELVSVQYNTGGYTTNADGSRVPMYTTVTGVSAQVQPLATGELAMIEALNIQGVSRRFYVDGAVDAIIRAYQEGGTIIIRPNGDVYKITNVPENWDDANPGWTCCIGTLQNNS